eukprot:COSAG06_NODE_333_length_17341_cov_7.601032_26_plen_123_part_00
MTPVAPPVPDERSNAQSLSSSFEVLLAKTATVDESFAAKELSQMLSNVTGTAVPIVDTKGGGGSGTLTLAVGYDAATAVGMPPVQTQSIQRSSETTVNPSVSCCDFFRQAEAAGLRAYVNVC